jgi:16S rRNA U516 pseudouridylate synthase RsuA-like enzyme
MTREEAARDDASSTATFASTGGTVHVPALIVAAFGGSRSDARRLLAEGAVCVNGEPLAADDVDLPAERLNGVLLQIGRRHVRRLRNAERYAQRHDRDDAHEDVEPGAAS